MQTVARLVEERGGAIPDRARFDKNVAASRKEA